MNSTHLVEAKGLNIRYGKKLAVDDVSFSIPPGRVVGLLGHNGAGKTTLMKALVGLSRAEGNLQVEMQTESDGVLRRPLRYVATPVAPEG